MTTLYRVFTERKKEKAILRMFAESFAEFTAYHANGYWQGKREKSLVIEILVSRDASAFARLLRTCRMVCGYNRQDAILVQEIGRNTMEAYLLTSTGRKEL